VVFTPQACAHSSLVQVSLVLTVLLLGSEEQRSSASAEHRDLDEPLFTNLEYRGAGVRHAALRYLDPQALIMVKGAVS